ncbi:MAG TPA: hypothetical protein GXX28_07795 [Firmicutes bacterium]|nr:hypothetical protein [Bacillota bacterium]
MSSRYVGHMMLLAANADEFRVKIEGNDGPSTYLSVYADGAGVQIQVGPEQLAQIRDTIDAHLSAAGNDVVRFANALLRSVAMAGKVAM